MTVPSCSIIIVNYNGRHFLEDCLPPVLSQEYAPFEVVVVDNGSADGSVEWLREVFPQVRVVPAETNLGFAGGNNLGVREAKSDRVVLLNNDTVVHPGWLAYLVSALEEGAAVASSFVRTRGIPAAYYEYNGSLNFLGHNIMRVFRQGDELFYCNGASLIFDRRVFGLPFDDDYFAYGEDVYLSLRARFRGLRVRHVHASIVDHIGSGTTRRSPSSRMTMLQERNRLLNMLLFFSKGTLLKVLPYMILNVIGKAGAGLAGRMSLAGVLGAYWWIASHASLISQKRRRIRSERCVSDREVILRMTAHLVNGESAAGRLINSVSRGYCRLVGLRTVELWPGVKR